MAGLGVPFLQKRGCFTYILRRVLYVIPFIVFIFSILGLYKSLTLNEVFSSSAESRFDSHSSITSVERNYHKPSQWVVISVQDMSEDLFNDLTEKFRNWFLLIIIPASNTSKLQRLDETSEICTESEIDARYNVTGLLPIAKAYLHAIIHGADWIYTHPAVNIDSLQDIYPPTIISSGKRLVLEDASNLFDARAHFGCRNIGEPSLRSKNFSLQKYSLSANRISTYIHASASINPLYIPTTANDTTASTTLLVCDDMSSPVSLSRQLFADISLNGITFHRSAFWALPVNLEMFSKRWIRAVQWLVWETGGRLTVDRVSSLVNNQMPDKSLSRFSCDHNPTFLGCVRSLVTSILPHEVHFQKSVNQWLDALNVARYEFPELKQISNIEIASRESQVLYEPIVRPMDNIDAHRKRLWLPVVNRDASLRLYEKTCRWDEYLDTVINKPGFKQDFSKTVDLSEHPWTQFQRVVLVIVFNTPIYSVIPYLEILYRPFFPYIVYCGPVLLDDAPLLSEYELNFVVYPSSPIEHQPGSFNYDCVGLATRLFNPSAVEGFLVTSDDLLVLIPKIIDAPRDVVWFLSEDEIRIGELKTLRECRLGMCDYHPHWHWWDDYAAATMRALKSLSATKDDTFRQCHHNLIRRNGAEMRANGGFSDVYYIPQSLVEDFSKLASLFVEHLVFLEIAVPTIIRCLVEPSQVWGRLSGLQIWTVEHRDEPWQYFNKALLYQKMFLHPTKWSGLVVGVENSNLSRKNETVALVNVYCRRILPYLHDPLARLPV